MAKFKVTFKESYMPKEVTRVCELPNEEEVIRIYDLDNEDIEWYMILRLD